MKSYVEEENDLFSRFFKGGILIIEDSIQNRHVYNRTEGFCFKTWPCRVKGL